MPLIQKYDRDNVDIHIDGYLNAFYSLPRDAAIAALAELSCLPMMEKFDPKNPPPYPALPELFQQKVYQGKEVQEALNALSLIMYSRQPQERPARDKKVTDALNEMQETPQNWGCFNSLLHNDPKKRNESISAGGVKIEAEDVHHYMKYKFAATACNVLAFHEARTVVAEIEQKSDSNKVLFQSCLARSIESGEESMPEELQALLSTEQTIKPALQAILQPEESDFRTFLSFLDQSAIGFVSDEKQHIQLSDRPFLLDAKKIAANFFALPPELFDKEMAANIDAVCNAQISKGRGIIKLEILKTPSYQSIQDKIKDQIETGKHFSKDVLSSFAKVIEVKEMLNRYSDAIKIHAPDLVVEAKKICQDYVDFLNNTLEDKWLPLEKATLDKLEEVLQSAKDFSDDFAFIDWTRDFFSLYFSTHSEEKPRQLVEQAAHLKKMFYYALDQNKVFISDNWIQEVYEETRTNHPEEKGVVLLEPQHRNRVFLHALNLPVGKWTPIFYQTFNEILTLLETSTDPDVIREKLSSYPDEFIDQLRWLRDHYNHVVVNKQVKSNIHRNSVFPMLYYNYSQMKSYDFLKLLSNDSIPGVFQNFRTYMEPSKLAPFITSLRSEQMAILFSNCDNWPECFEEPFYVIEVLRTLYNDAGHSDLFCAGMALRWPVIINCKSFTLFDVAGILHWLPNDQKNIFYENMKGSWGKIIHTNFDQVDNHPSIHLTWEQKNDIANIELIKTLNDYIQERKGRAPTARMNIFVWSDQHKISAANALIDSIRDNTSLDKKHIKPLCDGTLKNQLEVHLSKFRPGVTLEQFLEEQTRINRAPAVLGLRRNSSDSE